VVLWKMSALAAGATAGRVGSMTTTARPAASARVVATYFPSGDQAGKPYPAVPASATDTVSPAASMIETDEPSRLRRATAPVDARRPTGPGVCPGVEEAAAAGLLALALGDGRSGPMVRAASDGDGAGAGAHPEAPSIAIASTATTHARARHPIIAITTRYARGRPVVRDFRVDLYKS
jgi:hypothetical protein